MPEVITHCPDCRMLLQCMAWYCNCGKEWKFLGVAKGYELVGKPEALKIIKDENLPDDMLIIQDTGTSDRVILRNVEAPKEPEERKKGIFQGICWAVAVCIKYHNEGAAEMLINEGGVTVMEMDRYKIDHEDRKIIEEYCARLNPKLLDLEE